MPGTKRKDSIKFCGKKRYMPNTTLNFGRFQTTDDRDKLHLCPIVTTSLRSKEWETIASLDQKDTTACVAYSGLHWLADGPIKNSISDIDPDWLYRQCKLFDALPGENYNGTNIRALFKVFRSMGLISEYKWANSVEMITNWVLNTSPMVVGTPWFSNMMNPMKGFVRLGGDMMGGHAYVIVGCDLDKRCPDGTVGAFKLQNSLGTNWADAGQSYISIVDFSSLFGINGEACTGIEIEK